MNSLFLWVRENQLLAFVSLTYTQITFYLKCIHRKNGDVTLKKCT